MIRYVALVTTLNGGGSDGSGTLEPANLTTPEEFGAALTALRDRLGLSIRQVARITDIPNATLGGYFAGRHLPPPTQPRVLATLLDALGVPPESHASWREAAIRLRRAPGPRAQQSPYRGLESYRVDDAEVYVGREDEIDQLLELIDSMTEGPRCIAIIGPSGVGKSSLIHAGLMAKARSQGIAGTSLNPLESAEELARLASAPIGSRQLVALDQFEQALIDGVDETRKAELINQIEELADRPDTVVILGLRADFYARALLEPALLPLMAHQVPVGPMSDRQKARVITEPAAALKQPVEPAFVDLVLRDLGARGAALSEATQLPLLSHALLMTWEHGQGRGLSVASYAAIGGVAGAVQATAEAAFDSLGDEAQRATRSLFELMLPVDSEGIAIRRPALYGDIKDEPALVDAAETFVAHRILTATSTGYAISHESLATAWPRLAEWLEDDQDSARARHRLAIAAASWDENGRSDDGLIRGTLLAAAAVLGEDGTVLTSAEAALVAASNAAEAAQRKRDRRARNRLRAIAICALVLAVATTALSAVLIKSRSELVNERDNALSRQVADQAELLRSTNPALAAQLALAAYQIAPTTAARSVVLEATGEPLVTRLLGAPGPMRATPSPDGKLLAVATSDSHLRVFSLAAGSVPRLVGTVNANAGQLYGIAWSTDSRLIAVGGAGGKVVVFDASTPSRPITTQSFNVGANVGVENLHFDGPVLFAATSAPSLLRWRLEANKATELPAITDFGGTVQDVAISPKGLIATASADGFVRLWDPAGKALKLHQKMSIGSSSTFSYSVAFSPDGKYLADTENDKIARVFDVSGARAKQVATLGGFTSWVNSVAFSPDGKQLAAGASGSLVQTWAVGTWQHESSFTAPSAITTVAYSADGKNLIAGTLDGTTLVWPAANNRPRAYGDSIWTVAGTSNGLVYLGVGSNVNGVPVLDVRSGAPAPAGEFTGPASAGLIDGSASTSADGRWLGSGTSTGNVLFWRTSGPPSQPIVMPAASKLIEYTAFSPNGKLFAATADDGTITVFDVAGTTPRQVSQFHISAQGFGVAFSPDNSLLAAGGTDNVVHLFEVGTGKQIATLKGFANYVYGVAFSPDGEYVAGGSTDKTVRIWNISNPDRPQPLPDQGTGPTDSVYTLSWNGNHLLGASQDGSLWIWETSSQGAHPWAQISNLGAGATSAAFLPNGRIVGTGNAGVVDFWDGDIATASRDICSHAGSAITPSEWRLYVPGADYRNPCG